MSICDGTHTKDQPWDRGVHGEITLLADLYF